MPPRKRGTSNLEASDTKIGDAVPKAVIDTAKEVVGVPAQISPVEEIAEVRGQIEALRGQIAKIGGGARQAVRQTEAAAKSYPKTSVLVVAAISALVVLAVTGIGSAPKRTRSERILDELQDLYDRARRHF